MSLAGKGEIEELDRYTSILLEVLGSPEVNRLLYIRRGIGALPV